MGPKATAHLIKTLAALSGKKQTELAAAAQTNKSSVSNYFRGKTDLRSESLVHLLKLFGIDLNQIIQARLRDSINEDSYSSSDIGSDLSIIFAEADPIFTKAILGTVTTRFTPRSISSRNALVRLEKHAHKIPTVEKEIC